MQPGLVALFVLAFVLYAVASVGAAGVPLDLGVAALAFVAAASALAPLWLRRPQLEAGAPLVAALGTAQALGLAAFLARSAHALLAEVGCALALPAIGVSVLRLAFAVPDTPGRLRRHTWIRHAGLSCALLGAVLGVLAALPPWSIAGRWLIAPYSWSLAPAGAAGACWGAALLLRLGRRWLGSEPWALAANLWALLALGAASLVGGGWLARAGAPRAFLHGLLALCALFLLVGHAWSVAPARVRVASLWARELAAGTGAFALALGGCVLLARWLPVARVPLALAPVFLLTFLSGRRALRPLVVRACAPHGGRLLAAIEEARADALGAPDFMTFASSVLKPLRRAGSLPETAPKLATFDPARVVQLDAAGVARKVEQALPSALAARLCASERLGEPLVERELAALLPRRPELAGVVKALAELDALCVVPLLVRGELEGALVVARGARRDPLTLEELLALERLAAHLAPICAGLLALERTQARADLAEAARATLGLRAEEQAGELAEQRTHMAALKAGLGLPLPARDPVRYSRAMRALVEPLERAAPHDLPLLLWGETGSSLAPVAQWIHRVSGRAHEPFAILDASALEPERALAQLFGAAPRGTPPRPGLLELLGAGTLLLDDVCALPHEVQLALAEAIEERRARPAYAHGSYPLRVRMVATARRPLTELEASGALVPELARWFAATSYRVPPLRERPEDLESLLLLALDRSARVLGQPAKGVEAEALKVLVAYEWPGNEAELASVIERAAARAQGPRIALMDLPPLANAGAELAHGSFAEQERAILQRALRRADGDRTRAARALGLKRATFVDKLRRLGIQDPTSAEN